MFNQSFQLMSMVVKAIERQGNLKLYLFLMLVDIKNRYYLLSIIAYYFTLVNDILYLFLTL